MSSIKIKRRLFLLILIFLFLATLLFFSPVSISGETTPTPTPDSSSEQLNQARNRIQELENKIIELQGQKKTLSSQIAVIDSQIKLTQLRINATKQEIEDLTKDIGITTEKISKLEVDLNKITKVLLNRIIATYEVGTAQPFHILLYSNSVSDFFTRLNYLKIAQAHDRKLIFETQQTKNDYTNQKQIFEDKKAKVEALKKQLEDYTAQIEREKLSKQQLLEVTQNDERRYQELLAKARAEMAAIEGVVATIKLKDGTPIKEGQTIAVMGNSGAPYCSTGPHLHFEIRKNGNIEDPNNYLRGGISYGYSYPLEYYGYYGTINPHGSWNWPLNEPIKINQGFGGSHSFAKSFYPNGFHAGIDMEADSALIKAPKDGTLYKGSTSCGGMGMNFAAIDHGDGLISWYWHVQ